MKYKNVKLDILIPYARNARVHSEKQIAQIAASIKEFGFINPVIIDKYNGIIAGHGRVLAAQKLNLVEIPCIKTEHLSEIQKRAYILADNRLAETSIWDNEMLKVELEDLKINDFNINISGFEDFKFEEFIPDLDHKDDDKQKEQAFVLRVEFENYDEQQLLFNELRDRGLKVKV